VSARERERERRRDKTTTTTTTRKVRKEEERTPGPSDPRATMSSSVLHYRFKTATETNTLRFEGHSLRVFDVKVGREGGRVAILLSARPIWSTLARSGSWVGEILCGRVGG